MTTCVAIATLKTPTVKIWRTKSFADEKKFAKLLLLQDFSLYCILNSDFEILLSSATNRHGSAAAATRVFTHTSWCCQWDIALDQGVKRIRIMQAIFKELCRPSFCFQCLLCDDEVTPNSSCLEHACSNYPRK